MESHSDFYLYTFDRSRKELESKVAALVLEKLKEKGLSQYHVSCYNKGDWKFYYADTGPDIGTFIVAVRGPFLGDPVKLGDYRANKMYIEWQDTYPGIISID